MPGKPTTVAAYLAALPADRRATLERVMATVRANADTAYEEGMQYGMIAWYVPHAAFPAGYHADPKQPLPFLALASQKNHCSLYLMTAYGEGSEGEAWLRKHWPATAKKLDMGKSCIRFKSADDLALDVVGQAIKRMPLKKHLAWYAAHDPRLKPRSAPTRARKASTSR